VGDTKEQQQFNYKGGVRVLVRNQSDSPFPIDFGMDVATGIQVNIILNFLLIIITISFFFTLFLLYFFF
jgi:hypothetical protein